MVKTSNLELRTCLDKSLQGPPPNRDKLTPEQALVLMLQRKAQIQRPRAILRLGMHADSTHPKRYEQTEFMLSGVIFFRVGYDVI